MLNAHPKSHIKVKNAGAGAQCELTVERSGEACREENLDCTREDTTDATTPGIMLGSKLVGSAGL